MIVRAAAFDAFLDAHRRIDEELWK